MGSPDDFSKMIDFVNLHRIKPIVSHIFSLEEANEAMGVIASGDQFGKVCLEIPDNG